MINDKKHRTAIGRTTLSLPARFLVANELLTGLVLDFGCGRGDDAKELGIDKFDPFYYPQKPEQKAFDTVMVNYVANVLEDDEIPEFLEDVRAVLKKGGKAYISVRRDVKKEGWTSKGTYQRNVELDLPVVETKSKGKYRMYLLQN